MSLPATYARWLEELLGSPPPNEPLATCDDCVMCRPEVPEDYAFNPDTRCCTYIPRLPNYLVGRLLDDPNPALAFGRGTVQARITGEEGVQPLGVELTAAHSAAYERLLADETFGRDDEVACPHQMDDGRCGIWLHRNGVCATWFCRHQRGIFGDRFWEAVQQWLTAIEHALGLWVAEAVMYERDLPVDHAALLAGEWGRWTAGPEAFYRACAEQVRGLSWRAIRRIGGRKVKKKAKAVRQAWTALHDLEVPSHLWFAGYDELDGDDYARKLMGYCGTDHVEVPGVLPRLLDLFDGRQTAVVLAELRAEGIELKTPLMRSLYEHQILVDDEPDD